MVEFFDPTLGETQPESLREEFISRMSPGVVVFQMAVLKLEAKHKMSQNKPNQDRDLVIKSLSAGGAPDQVELAEWMKTR
jgi:predicted FMN-binding regulatory protein PaiB